MNAHVCSVCGGRFDTDELGTFYWVPQAPGDEPGIQDATPVCPGDVCCDGGSFVGTPYEHVLAAAADFDF